LKKRNRRASSSIDDDDLNISNRLKADSYQDGDEIIRRLEMAIETLPDKQKIVFNMRYYDEMSYQEMSDVLNTSVGALKSSFHHALKKIETYLKEVEI
jgi:RNA polymerase sigma-70 factor (ECF subfamily)